MKAKVYILLLNYRTWEDTVECIESLLQSTYQNYRVIVIDNGSGNDSLERLMAWAHGFLEVPAFRSSPINLSRRILTKKPISYMREDEPERECKLVFTQAAKNLGFAGGINLGIRYVLSKDSDPQWFLLLNNDTVVETDCLEKLMVAAETDERTGIVTGLIKYYRDPSMIWCGGGVLNLTRGVVYHFRDDQVKARCEMNFASGALMLIRGAVLRDVGLLNEGYFLGAEDWEFSYKAVMKGWKIIYDPLAVVYHKVGGSSDGENSPLMVYHSTRGRRHFIVSNLGGFRRVFATFYFYATRTVRLAQWVATGQCQKARALLRAMITTI